MMKGLILSKGIGIGVGLVLKDEDYAIPKHQVSDVSKSIVAYEEGVTYVTTELKKIVCRLESKQENELAAVFEAHILMLQDPELDKCIRQHITEDKRHPAEGVNQARQVFMEMMLAIEDPYFRERAKDIDEVCRRLIKKLLDIEDIDLSHFEKDTILIAKELLPGQTAMLDRTHVKGIIMATGGQTSHSAIIANNLGIPAMVLPNILELDVNHQQVILDCIDNQCVIGPSQGGLEEAHKKIVAYENRKKALNNYMNQLGRTADGLAVEVAANISQLKDIDAVLEVGADGVGLFRSEFLYMDRLDFPTEEEQFHAYKKVLEAMDGKSVIIRTFDIGGDKQLSYYPLEKEDNPFMGYRAIRISLKDRPIFVTQLRAILRASVYGQCKLMFPMIASIEELRIAKRIVKETMETLRKEGIPFDEKIPVGIMVEIPSVAITAELYADEVDFFSIGTNDLTQYTLAADRMNQRVAAVYESYNPGVLKLIGHTVRAGVKAGIMVGMCGEMAGDPLAIPYLIGLGMTELSMSSGKVLEAKQLLSLIKKDALKELVKTVDRLKTAKEIKDYLSHYVNKLQ